ncbi:MAG: PIN domain-containing protein [Cellulomonadaceae bacterium]|jgi:predicted nucleic acid-binding protein|nr:PIN domain-containing protein [Cellulomonadaceae bacterium]
MKKTVLLDANVLIALFQTGHSHHRIIQDWFSLEKPLFATTPITEGSLARYIYRIGGNSTDISRLLAALENDPNHVFWPDNIPMTAVDFTNIFGHKQVTDAYLAELARFHNAKIATVDFGLAITHPDVAIYLGTWNLH